MMMREIIGLVVKYNNNVFINPTLSSLTVLFAKAVTLELVLTQERDFLLHTLKYECSYLSIYLSIYQNKRKIFCFTPSSTNVPIYLSIYLSE